MTGEYVATRATASTATAHKVTQQWNNSADQCQQHQNGQHSQYDGESSWLFYCGHESVPDVVCTFVWISINRFEWGDEKKEENIHLLCVEHVCEPIAALESATVVVERKEILVTLWVA